MERRNTENQYEQERIVIASNVNTTNFKVEGFFHGLCTRVGNCVSVKAGYSPRFRVLQVFLNRDFLLNSDDSKTSKAYAKSPPAYENRFLPANVASMGLKNCVFLQLIINEK
jgi:hypothetical protein